MKSEISLYTLSVAITNILVDSLATHLLLLMFELLAADNLESRRHYWILVFVPLVSVFVAPDFESGILSRILE